MSASNEDLARAISGRLPSMLALLSELVTQNSHSGQKVGGNLVGERLAREAEAVGLEPRRIQSENFADHWVLFSRRAAESAEGAVVFVGHHDTVFPPGSFEGFRLKGEFAHGPGVLDMKGGIVVMLEAVRALHSVNLLDDLALRIILVGDEEVGSPEGRPVLQREAAGAACALVFEAGRAADRIITRRKGTGNARVTAHGKAAHAANDHKSGVNAIWALARFIDRAQALTDYARGVTVNVGTITGGEARNTVPDQAECAIDFRFETLAEGQKTFEALQEAAEQAARSVVGASIEVQGGIGRAPLERSDASAALAAAYGIHAKAAGLGSEEAALIAGGSDASTTSSMGIPSIDGMGPRGTGFHTKQERIEVATLEPKTLALARFLRQQALSSSEE